MTGKNILFGTLVILLSLICPGCSNLSLQNGVNKDISGIISGRDGTAMVFIPAGEFMMGTSPGTGSPDEEPQRKVYLDAYYIDSHEVTVAQYRRFCRESERKMPEPPPWGWVEKHPMVMVSWQDASDYALHYGKRLPTEAEWEKACRAGSSALYHHGNRETELDNFAWYRDNSCEITHPVSTKAPNEWGIYDMLGNVWEWCSDWYSEDYYKHAPFRNPAGPGSGTFKVMRGGGWPVNAFFCRCANRYRVTPESGNMFSGFRCAVSAP